MSPHMKVDYPERHSLDPLETMTRQPKVSQPKNIELDLLEGHFDIEKLKPCPT